MKDEQPSAERSGSTGSGADRIWHPYTRQSALREGPLPVIARGEGPYLFDESGRRYIDAVSSWWCCHLGHGHPRLVEAIRRQSAVLQHSILGNLSHRPALDLAARLAEMMPDPARRVHFTSDGSCAVEAALKAAVQYFALKGEGRRTRIVSLENAYHGDSIGAVSAGYLDHFHAMFRPLLFPVDRLPVPYLGTDPGPARDAAREFFRRRGDEVAAVIVEPLCQGAAGMKMYPPEFLRQLFDLAKEAGALFICDEIAMGFGRTGRWFGFEHAGIDPDLVCVGKGLSAGYLPVSALVAKESVCGAFTDEGGVDGTFYHGHTWGGNPVACAVALEALDIYREIDAPALAERKGRRLRASLEPLRAASGVREVRSLGLIAAVEFEAAAAVTGADGESRMTRIRRRLRRSGVLARPLGPVVYLMPPVTTPDAVLDDLAVAFLGAVAATA